MTQTKKDELVHTAPKHRNDYCRKAGDESGNRPLLYDVQLDPEAKSLTVFDRPRKVQLISNDEGDNIKLKGSSNYKILIRGKPSSLVADGPSNVSRLCLTPALISHAFNVNNNSAAV